MTATAVRAPLVMVANARMPSQRAQSLQVAQVAAAFARRGARTTLLYAKRRDTAHMESEALWDHYAVPTGARPEAEAVSCMDWIDVVPRKLQFWPARLQEITFARRAAARIKQDFAGATVLSREVETAHVLRGRANLFLEIHRVPGGSTRRGWLLEAARAVAGLIAISGGVKDDLIGIGVEPAKLTVEHDAFEPGRFADLPSREEARAALELPQDRQVVVYTGGLLAWKGVDVLVDAARLLPEVQFVIAGGMDADVALMKKHAGDLPNVRFDGFQPPARVGLYLAAGDLGVVPNRSTPEISARYTSPLKVFEAMAAGLPLVVSDLPSLRDILDEDTARFAAADDPAALAEGLRAVLADDGERGRLATNLAARADEHTWDARAARLLNWMETRA